MKDYWVKMEYDEFTGHYIEMTDEQIAADVRKSISSFINHVSTGDSFGAKMVRKAKERIDRRHRVNSENGRKGAESRWNTTEGAANGNNADVSATAPTVDAPATPDDWKSLVSASLSMAGTSNNEAAVTTKNQRQRRTGGSVREAVDPLPPVRQRVKLPSSMNDVADFANRENLDYDDARLWWEQNFVERKGKDKDGNRITNWHGALINFCKSQEKKRNG